jgi:hypothetical protein
VLQPHQVAYSGRWRVEAQRIVAGANARLRIAFVARHVYLVLAGHGPVQVRLNGSLVRTVEVDGARLYTLLDLLQAREGVLELRFARGLEAYAFTFG